MVLNIYVQLEKRCLRKDVKPPRHVEVSLFVHATEDLEKVLKAARNIFPAAYAQDLEFEKSIMHGYYKNPIIMLRLSIKERTKVAAFLKNLLSRLETDDRILLTSALGEYVDSKGTLYMRFDKQEALLNKIRLCSVDPILVKTKLNFLPRTLDELESTL